MMPPLAPGRLENAMAEEFENFAARLAEARRAVERWEAEGGAQETGQPVERLPDAVPDTAQSTPTGKPGVVTHHRGDLTEE